MKLPIKSIDKKGIIVYYTEAEVIEIVDRCINKLCHTFKFSYHVAEDIKQEGWLIALKALNTNFDNKYDWKQPLDRIMYRHLNNRLINFKRDNYTRNEPPCDICINAIDGATGHADNRYCKKYLLWQKRNTAKKNIINPIDIFNISDENEQNTKLDDNILDEIASRELLDLIDSKLPVSLRSTFLQIKAGQKVSRTKRLLVEEAVKDILKGNIDV